MQIRERVDARVAPLRAPDARSALARPVGGWVHAVRLALGMSMADLASRLSVTPAAVAKLETSEQDRRVRLDTLARAADALDCDLVYALVPRTTLADTLERQARTVALARIGQVTTTMALESQAVPGETTETEVERVMRQVVEEPGLWRR